MHAVCSLVTRALFVGMIAAVSIGAQADEEGFESLFDGKSLDGWKASENAASWKVADGEIVAHGPRSHLFYVGADPESPPTYKNFHLVAEVLTKPKANSGIFFHTQFQEEGWPAHGYEAQVNNSSKDPVRTGSLYAVIKNLEAPAKDDEWFIEDVIVKGDHITIKVNGKTIVDYVEKPDDTKGDRKLSSGTFALQAHDPGSEVHYRAIRVKRLPD